MIDDWTKYLKGKWVRVKYPKSIKYAFVVEPITIRHSLPSLAAPIHHEK